MIVREPKSAERSSYDLIVVGGGIYGVALTLHAAALRKKVLLLERGDFGQETSANTLRIVHGGLRYLQHLDLPRFRQSVEARRWWLATFPDLVRPLPCLMPLYGEGLRRPAVLRVALALNDRLSARRNRYVPSGLEIPNGKVLGPLDTSALFPGGRQDGLRGGALWTDASMESPHRLLVEMLRWASAAGASTLNYVSAKGLLASGGVVGGVHALDELAGETLEFTAPVVVNAAGPWSAELSAAFDRPHQELFRPSLAFNVLLRAKLPSMVAVAVAEPGAGKPAYFLRPIGDLTYAGTVHAPFPEGRDPTTAPDADEVAAFLESLGRAVPGFRPEPRDVIRIARGLLPAARAGSDTLAKHPVVVDHGRRGGPKGLFSVSGVKFTTAPAVALQTLRAAGIVGARALEPGLDSKAAAGVRPAVRPTVPAPAPGDDMGLFLATWRYAIQAMIREEAVVRTEDLISRRLDWTLADLDLAAAAKDLAWAFPELGVSPPTPRR